LQVLNFIAAADEGDHQGEEADRCQDVEDVSHGAYGFVF
jgi:hypothetical protein